MKIILYTILIILISTPKLYANEKIAVVNITNIFQQLPQRILIAEKLENEFKHRIDELQSMENDLQRNIQKLQKNHSTMEDKERNMLEKSVILQRETFNDKAQELEQDNNRRQIEERNKLLNNIQKAIQEIAKQEGYSLVLDSNAIAYAEQKYKDITYEVIKKFQ